MEDIANISDAIPLVRGDTWKDVFIFFYDDADGETAHDLSGNTVEATIRWDGGSQAVTVDIVDSAGGQVKLSLAKEDTGDIPLGELSNLFVDELSGSDRQTWFRIPIDGKEGYST